MATDTFVIRVAGVSFHQANLTHVQVGNCCLLVPEPSNPYDRNAIQVIADGQPKLMLGYIPKHCNEVLLDAININCEIKATIDSIGTAAGSNLVGISLRLEITYPP